LICGKKIAKKYKIRSKKLFFLRPTLGIVCAPYYGVMTEDWMPTGGTEKKVRVNRIHMINEAIRSGIFPTVSKLARKEDLYLPNHPNLFPWFIIRQHCSFRKLL